MKETKQLEIFLQVSIGDRRLNPTHISLYLALFITYKKNAYRNPISLIGSDLMKASKIKDKTKYFLFLKQLQDYGYIRYLPTRSPLKLNMAHLLALQLATFVMII